MKAVLFGILVLAVSTAGVAQANNLDPKWASARKEANALGDAAKAGDRDALRRLENLAENGHAPASHNLGWLHQNGFTGRKVNWTIACRWFAKGAQLIYPPSMHMHGECLASKNDGSPEMERLILDTWFDAGKAGWVRSAIRYAEIYRDSTFLIPDSAVDVIDTALESNPSQKQERTLYYLKGSIALHNGERWARWKSIPVRVVLKEGEAALAEADRQGHEQAAAELAEIRRKWLNQLIADIEAHNPPPYAATCLKELQDTSKSPRERGECYLNYLVHLELYLDRLYGFDHLAPHLSEEENAAAARANALFDEMDEVLSVDGAMWQEELDPIYWELQSQIP